MPGLDRSDSLGDARESRNRLTDLVRDIINDTGGGRTLGQVEADRARHSPLERLVADAGPLGKFATDADDAMPAGTSAFTTRSDDTALRVASRTGIVTEPVLAGNPLLAPPPPDRLPATALLAQQLGVTPLAPPGRPEPVGRLAVPALAIAVNEIVNLVAGPPRPPLVPRGEPSTPDPSALRFDRTPADAMFVPASLQPPPSTGR